MGSESKKLYRSRANRMIGGICGGLGEFFSIDPTVVRVVFVLGMLLGHGLLLLLYIIMFFIVPEVTSGSSSTIPSTASAFPELPQEK
jgi:phage shock protein PspC (stress-responsive transcriptional regulator)